MITRAFLIGSIVSLVGLVACSSKDTSPAGSTTGAPAPGCNVNPWSCPAGQTCFEADPNGVSFSCQNSGKLKAGETCMNLHPPECDDGLICFAVQNETHFVCTEFCDPTDAAHACPNKGVCQELLTQGGQAIHECVPPAEGAGGAGGSGGSTATTSTSTGTTTTATTTTTTGTGGAGGAGGAGGKSP